MLFLIGSITERYPFLKFNQIIYLKLQAGPADTSDPPHPKTSPTIVRDRKCKFKATTSKSLERAYTSDNEKKSKEKVEKRGEQFNFDFF